LAFDLNRGPWLRWQLENCDALEFPDGQIVLLTCLREGQEATPQFFPGLLVHVPAAFRRELQSGSSPETRKSLIY
jgi:hypothetical protein